MLTAIYFCYCLFTKMCRGLHWDGTGHKQNWKAISVPMGRGRFREEGRSGEMCPLPTSKALQDLLQLRRVWMLQEPSRASSQAHSNFLLNKLLLTKRWKRRSHDLHYLIVFSTLNLIEAATSELHLETDICICFADYRSCTFLLQTSVGCNCYSNDMEIAALYWNVP